MLVGRDSSEFNLLSPQSLGQKTKKGVVKGVEVNLCVTASKINQVWERSQHEGIGEIPKEE